MAQFEPFFAESLRPLHFRNLNIPEMRQLPQHAEEMRRILRLGRGQARKVALLKPTLKTMGTNGKTQCDMY